MKTAAIVAAAVLLAAAPPAMAVDEGVPDGARHPNVGLLAFDVDRAGPIPPAFLCSGSVLSDELFLTAAHCIAAMPPDVDWLVTLNPGAPAGPVLTPGVFPDEFPFALIAPATAGGVAVTHPDFDPDTRSHDVAVVRFTPGTFAGVTPVALPPAELLDRARRGGVLRRNDLRLVGYGADPEWGDEAPVFVVEGYRQTATAPFRALTRERLVLDGRARRTGRGSLCYGDSGSPQFVDGSNVVVSLFSEHLPDCDGPLYGQRLDTSSERRFLSRFVRLP
jgi:hypothetical protein